jgi:O-antigen ligase
VWRARALVALVALAALVPCFMRGGYSATSRAVFAALAGGAFLLASSLDEPVARRLLRKPAPLVLFLLGALGALSATWTVGGTASSLRWGFMVAGYAALAVAAGVLASRPRGLITCVAILSGVAVVTAVAGLVAFALHEGPWAERLAKSWRPEGPFEYPPALALVQVAALPGFLAAMVHLRRRWAVPSAAAATLAITVLALSSSRAELAFGALVLFSALVAPRRTVRAGAERVIPAIVVIVLGGIAGYGATRIARHGSDDARLIGIALAAVIAAGIWAAVRSRVAHLRLPSIPRRVGIAAAVACGALALLAAASLGQGGLTPQNGAAHGRSHIWDAAINTVGDRPLAGAGADSFLVASLDHQGATPTRYAHSLPIELAVELGIAGALLALALYGAAGLAAWRALRARGAWLVIPAVLAFLGANLVDWEWHEAGVGAIWAIALGATLALGASPRGIPDR